MPINLDEAIGAELAPVEFSWSSSDVQLYHLGLGAGADPMSERELREFTKRPVLGSLTKIEDPRDRDLLRQDRMKLAGVMGLFLLANVGWMAWISTRTAS